MELRFLAEINYENKIKRSETDYKQFHHMVQYMLTMYNENVTKASSADIVRVIDVMNIAMTVKNIDNSRITLYCYPNLGMARLAVRVPNFEGEFHSTPKMFFTSYSTAIKYIRYYAWLAKIDINIVLKDINKEDKYNAKVNPQK